MRQSPPLVQGEAPFGESTENKGDMVLFCKMRDILEPEMSQKAECPLRSPLRHRLRQWLRAKHKLHGGEVTFFPDQYLEQRLGLIRLRGKTRTFPWANA